MDRRLSRGGAGLRRQLDEPGAHRCVVDSDVELADEECGETVDIEAGQIGREPIHVDPRRTDDADAGPLGELAEERHVPPTPMLV